MGSEDVSDEAVKTLMVIVLIMAVIGVGMFIGGPLLSGWIIFKGWDNTGGLVKAGAVAGPILGIVYLFYEGGPDFQNQPELYLIVLSCILTVVLLAIGFTRRDDMFNV